MARRSTRIASSQGSQQSSPPSASQSSSPATGRKRKAESGASPSAKRGKKNEEKQTTIEDSMNIDKWDRLLNQRINANKYGRTDDAPAEPEKQQSPPASEQKAAAEKQTVEQEEPAKTETHTESKPEQDKPTDNSKVEELKAELRIAEQEAQANGDSTKQNGDTEASKDDKQDDSNTKGVAAEPEQKQQEQAASNGDSAVEPNARDDKVPSSILEKGIMYFIYRGRVNVESPDNVQDIARSYMVLRPLPHGAKLGDGTIGDEKNCRLIAIPKKVLPTSGKDRWIAFVEKSNASFKELKESFLTDDTYDTQTAGKRHTPAATPAAEGVYAVTTTGRESHIAYILTLPEKLGDVQNDLGLRPRGSFVVSVKNPQYPGPANTDIGKDPGYSQELQNKFRSLRWSPMDPAMMDYEGCQFLMIGEGDGLEKATETDDKGDPKEEMEKLEREDEARVEHLGGKHDRCVLLFIRANIFQVTMRSLQILAQVRRTTQAYRLHGRVSVDMW